MPLFKQCTIIRAHFRLRRKPGFPLVSFCPAAKRIPLQSLARAVRRTKVLTTVLFAAAVFAASGCVKRENRVLFDRTGREVTIDRPINRIVSTAPSNTEIIVALGMADKLVAIDRHSANIEGLPQNLPLLDFFRPDAEAIIKLAPDLIIANGHNATGSGEDPLRLLRETGIAVAYISMSKSIDDIYQDIAFIAELLQIPETGAELITAMKAQIAELTRQTADIEPKKTVYLEISAAPEMFTFGKDSFLNDMISAIGAINIFGNDTWIVTPSAEAVINRNPDVILTTVNYIDDPIAELKSRPGFQYINAVKNSHIYQIDTDSAVRPSPRILKALRQMSHAVYPEAYE